MPINQDIKEMEYDGVKTANDVADIKLSQGVLDENDPDSARFMVLIRNAMEDLQHQVETERSLYHKSRDELSVAESQSRRFETELNLEKERNSQLIQELERLEKLISEQNDINNSVNSEEADNYWNLYKEALNRIDELENSIQNDKRVEELELDKTQLENELDSYKNMISEYKSDKQKLISEINSLKEARDLGNSDLQNAKKEYDEMIQDLNEKLAIEKIEHESLFEQYNNVKTSLTKMEETLQSNNYFSLQELIDTVQIKSKEIESWKSKFHDLESTAGATGEKEIELHEREISVVSKEGYLDGKEASLTHLEEKLKLREKNLNDKAKELDQRSFTVSNLEKEIMEKQKEFESYVDDLNLREQSFNRMVEDYSINMEKVQLEQDSDYKKKLTKIENAKLELENGKAEYDRLKKELKTSRSEIEAERRSVEQIKSELEQKMKEVDAVKAETEKLKSELNSQKDELDRQGIEFRSQKLEFNEKKKSLDSLKDELVSLEKVLAAKSKQIEEDERQMYVKLEHANNDNLRKMSAQYESQLKSLERELGDIRKELDESRRALKEERESQDARKSQVAHQESRLRELEEREKSVRDLESLLSSQKMDLENKQKEFDVYINELESRQKEFEEFWFELDKRQKSISTREKELDSREALFNSQRAALSESERRSLEEREGQLYEKENRLKDKEGKFIERENKLAEKENKLIDRENKLMEKEKSLLEREMGLNDLEREMSSLGQRTKLVEESLLAREVKIEERESTNRTKESTLGRREALLIERECSMDRREADLKEKDQELRDRERELDEKERQLQLERKPLLDELIRIEERDKQLFERELAIQRSEDLLQEMEGVIKSREKELYEGMNSSNKDKEICELRRMIEDLELRNRDIERETQKTCQVLQQQIQEEMKQKEELLYTILHLHKQINSIGSSLGYGTLDGVGSHDSRDMRQNKTNSQAPGVNGGELNKGSSTTANENANEVAISEASKKNSDVIGSLEKTMKKLYEKLQATESREKNLLKELRQFTEKSKNSRIKTCSVSPVIKNVGGPDAGEHTSDSSALPGYPSEVQVASEILKPQDSKVSTLLKSIHVSTSDSSSQQILPTLTKNSPIMYPESPMVLMPLLTDIKNELNELKKSSESNINRVTQTDEKLTGSISRPGERSNIVGGISFIQPSHNNGVTNANSSQIYDNNLNMDYCTSNSYGPTLNNNNLPASSGINPPPPGSLVNNTNLHYPSISSSVMGGSVHEHNQLNAQASKIASILQSLRPNSGSVASSSLVPNKDIARKLLEHELHSLRQWKKGMKQWDTEFSASSHNKQEEAIAWKQFLDQQMQVIAKKLERRISAALQK
ncbi:kinesin [Cryptosporidium sp. chipmunk genotype I]|uniref:kinesin n=1 Tax=Cryptosporidium sp. chipmunk genotype I TaxID=1280935 RepID=UPI00351A6CA9|nr:kinesin [Cryptosporidium sp. chipmunk genotype I]